MNNVGDMRETQSLSTSLEYNTCSRMCAHIPQALYLTLRIYPIRNNTTGANPASSTVCILFLSEDLMNNFLLTDPRPDYSQFSNHAS